MHDRDAARQKPQEGSEAGSQGEFRPAAFFALRTPLLPFDELEAFGQGKTPGEAPASDSPLPASPVRTIDRTGLRAALERSISRPEIREALFLASPSLEASLETWRRDPESKKGQRTEQALVRYLYRMAARATPFGLFSGSSVGRIGEQTCLQLAGREAYRRHTRLDMDYLFALCQELSQDPALRQELLYHPNSSLYRAAGRLRYVESRLLGKERQHELVAVQAESYLEDVLEQAGQGATLATLAEGLAAREEVEIDEALAYLSELVDSQILVSSLSPTVTGPEPIHDLLSQLGSHSRTRSFVDPLGQVETRLDELDEEGLGNPPQSYRAVAKKLEGLPTEVELARLLQVDMIKPAPEATLGPGVVEEIYRGVEILRRLEGASSGGPLERFRARLRERYDECQGIPLVDLLDEEIGIGFEASGGPVAAASSLLEGLAFPAQAGSRQGTTDQVAWGRKEILLLDKLLAAQATGARQIELDAADLEKFPERDLPPSPDAFHVMATLAASSAQALAEGDLQILIRHAGGPSGANLLGRFCHADEELRAHVEKHLRHEEMHHPEAIFAEVVHLPQGRIGNVLLRPTLRSYEIPFLGRSGAPDEQQIPITDLLLSLEGDQIVLHSKRLGRQVIPRLTTAHNFVQRSLGLYRFLGFLQQQSSRGGIVWNWGAFESVAFLPRLTSGRLVLARARWRVPKDEIDDLTSGQQADHRFASVQRWRIRRQLPRWVVLVDGDNELPIDLDNALSVETLCCLARQRSALVLNELFPKPEELCAHGPEGRFVHEVIVPFERRLPTPLPALQEEPAGGSKVGLGPTPPSPPSPRETGAPSSCQRSFLPGSEWLYAKLYTGTATADEILIRVVAPLVEDLVSQGLIDHWFFLRYGDPSWHLRLRFHGDPGQLASKVLPRLHAATAPLLDDGRIWSLQLDTYSRELERYGAGPSMELAERLFAADSEAVLRILQGLEEVGDADGRWLVAARGIDRLLSDLGFGLEAKIELFQALQEAYMKEHNAGPSLRKQLADQLRRHRRRLAWALEARVDPGHPLAAAFGALDQRSKALVPIVAELATASRDNSLGVPWPRLASSLVHMFTNRLLRAEGRAHELVLYDYLLQQGRSTMARQRAEQRRAQKQAPRKAPVGDFEKASTPAPRPELEEQRLSGVGS